MVSIALMWFCPSWPSATGNELPVSPLLLRGDRVSVGLGGLDSLLGRFGRQWIPAFAGMTVMRCRDDGSEVPGCRAGPWGQGPEF